jgi:hypothetical protein
MNVQDIEDPKASYKTSNLPKIINDVASTMTGKVEARAEDRTYSHPGYTFIRKPGDAEHLVVRFYRVREDRKDQSLGYMREDGWVKGWVLERYLKIQQVAA